MNGFDFLLLGILALAGGAVLITQAWWRSSCASLHRARGVVPDGSSHLRQQAVRHGKGTGSSQADGLDAGRLAALKRTFTITRARSKSAPPSHGQPPDGLSHIMQCPEESFWKEWQNPTRGPEA